MCTTTCKFFYSRPSRTTSHTALPFCKGLCVLEYFANPQQTHHYSTKAGVLKKGTEGDNLVDAIAKHVGPSPEPSLSASCRAANSWLLNPLERDVAQTYGLVISDGGFESHPTRDEDLHAQGEQASLSCTAHGFNREH